MTDAETKRELEELRSQVAALSQARLAEPVPPGPAAAAAPAESPPADEHDLENRIEELVDLMGDELRNNPVLTGVALFVAGLLVGRMLR
jgi:hypothetical protein